MGPLSFQKLLFNLLSYILIIMLNVILQAPKPCHYNNMMILEHLWDNKVYSYYIMNHNLMYVSVKQHAQDCLLYCIISGGFKNFCRGVLS